MVRHPLHQQEKFVGTLLFLDLRRSCFAARRNRRTSMSPPSTRTPIRCRRLAFESSAQRRSSRETSKGAISVDRRPSGSDRRWHARRSGRSTPTSGVSRRRRSLGTPGSARPRNRHRSRTGAVTDDRVVTDPKPGSSASHELTSGPLDLDEILKYPRTVDLSAAPTRAEASNTTNRWRERPGALRCEPPVRHRCRRRLG